MSEEDTSDQETDYDQSLSEDASYIDDTWSEEDDDYGLEPDGEGLEPDPPDQDRDHSHPKSWYEEVEEEEGWRVSECENNKPREESWIDDSSQGGYEEDTERGGSYVQPCYSTWRSSQLTPRKLKNKVIYDSQYESSAEPCLFSFSGTRRDYPQWESNLDEYFRYYSIPKSKQLAYCLEQLRGEAKRWWRQEEEYRWYYKEPTIRNWGQLKLLMRERYAPPRAAKQSTKASNTSPRRNPAATIQPTREEVSISNAFENIDKLFDKIQRLIVTNGVVKDLSTQKDREPIKSCEQLMTKKQEIVSASENGIVQAKLSQPVYTAPMTTVMHLPLSISAKTGTGPKDKPSATLGLDPCREVKSEQTKLEETPPGPSSAKLEQPDKQLTDKSSSTLNLSKMVCYKCQNIGHIAKNCPTKRSKNLELNEGESKECDEIVKTDLRIPNASITHLSLPKSVETVSGVESELVELRNSPAQCDDQSVQLSEEEREEHSLQIKTTPNISGNTAVSPKLSEGKEIAPKAEKLVEQTQSNEIKHELKPELNNKLQPKIEHCKFSKLSEIFEIICYRCHKKGHYAITCPLRKIKLLEGKTELSKTSDSLVQSDLLNSSSSIMHLPWPRGFETGSEKEDKEEKIQVLIQLAKVNNVRPSFNRFIFIVPRPDMMHLFLSLGLYSGTNFEIECKAREYVRRRMEPTLLALPRNRELEDMPTAADAYQSASEQCLGGGDNFKEKPPDPAKNTERVDQISLVFASPISHDASSVLKRLLHIGENEEINCLKPQIEQDFAKNSAKGFDPIDLCCHKESIMHLCLAKKVDLDAGAKEERRRRNSLGENLPINQVPAQRRSVHVLINAPKGERDEPGQTRGAVLSYLLKGEPPDVPNNTIPHTYQGKTLNSQRRMKANLLSIGAGHIVSRTKPFEEGEYDVDIKSTSTKEHEEVMQLTSRRTYKGSGRDQLTLVGAERETKAYQWAVTVCTLFPYPWFCPNGFYRKGFNEANWFTYLKPIRKLVGSHGDLRSLFESLRPNREELSCELTWSRILIQFWFSSNWIHTKSYFGLKDIKFLTRRILHLPYLELFEFERLQTYIWRPGDNLNLIEASRVQATART